MVIFGYSSGFILLVALAVIVGYKFYHEHMMAGGISQGSSPGDSPNATNPATGGGLKY